MKDDASRRRFLKRFAGGAAGAGAVWAASGCGDFGEFMDYMTLNEDDKVTDRFYDSISGHGRKQVMPPSAGNTFSFLWISDMHITTGENDFMEDLGKSAAKAGAQFILHSGDMVDQGENKEYERLLDLKAQYLPVPMFSAVGNHDIYHDGWDRFLKYVGPGTFRLRYANCDFIFIDTAAGTLGRDQMDWLESTLKHSDKTHKFVLSHYPVYDGATQTPSSMGNTEERIKLYHLFDKYNLSCFLSGHKHTGDTYKSRGVDYIIAGAGCPYKAIVQDEPHFYRFDVDGPRLSKDKIYF